MTIILSLNLSPLISQRNHVLSILLGNTAIWQLDYAVDNDFKGHLTLKVLVATIDAQWEGMGNVGSARYEPALLPPCPTIRVSRYSN